MTVRQAGKESGCQWMARQIRRERETDVMRAETRALVELAKRDPRAAAERINRICSHCGRLQVPTVLSCSLPWEPHHEYLVFPGRCTCPEEEAALVDKECVDAAKAKADREQAQKARLDRAGLTGILASATFATFGPRQDWPNAEQVKAKVSEFATTMLNGGLGQNCFLILVGEYGTGKSHLAAAVVRSAAEAGWTTSRFVPWLEYLEQLKASYRPDAEMLTSEVERQVKAARCLVIDDLDKRERRSLYNGSDSMAWPRELLYPIMDSRVRDCLPTILTLNTSIEARANGVDRLQLEDYIGRAVLDRMLGAAWGIIGFDGPSYRSGIEWK